MSVLNIQSLSKEHVTISENIQVFCRIGGAGSPLFIVNGGPGATHDYMLGPLLALAQSNRLVFYDQRGRGASSAPKEKEGYTVEADIDDLKSLMTELGFCSARILGHSYGGMIGFGCAIKYPDMVEKLIVSDSVTSARGLQVGIELLRRQLTQDEKSALEKLENSGKICGDADYLETAFSIVGKYYWHNPDFASKSRSGRYNQTILRLMWGAHPFKMIDGNLNGCDFTDRLDRIQCPTLILTGKFDLLSPLPYVRTASKRIRGCKLIVFEESGHLPFVEEAESFINAVESFLSA